jgi:hypothetical protein
LTVATWTRVADPEADAALLPAWFAARMAGARGSFGLLLGTGDVLRVASVAAAHLSSDGTVLLDVLLDRAGVPEEIDTAWRSKHYLGAPVPGAAHATVNLAHVVAAVEFTAEQEARRPEAMATAAGAEAPAGGGIPATVVELRQAAEDAAERRRGE